MAAQQQYRCGRPAVQLTHQCHLHHIKSSLALPEHLRAPRQHLPTHHAPAPTHLVLHLEARTKKALVTPCQHLGCRVWPPPRALWIEVDPRRGRPGRERGRCRACPRAAQDVLRRLSGDGLPTICTEQPPAEPAAQKLYEAGRAAAQQHIVIPARGGARGGRGGSAARSCGHGRARGGGVDESDNESDERLLMSLMLRPQPQKTQA
eukprot:364940-Chlamydomonas_euryale.AAC.7